MWWKNMKFWLIMIFVIAVIIAIIVGEFCGSDPLPLSKPSPLLLHLAVAVVTLKGKK